MHTATCVCIQQRNHKRNIVKQSNDNKNKMKLKSIINSMTVLYQPPLCAIQGFKLESQLLLFILRKIMDKCNRVAIVHTQNP